jgi:hypothetical protein
VDVIQGGSSFASFDTSGLDWSAVAIGYFRADCTDLSEANSCTWNWNDDYSDWYMSRVYFVRENDWDFSRYEFTFEIPFFPRGGSYVIVAYNP